MICGRLGSWSTAGRLGFSVDRVGLAGRKLDWVGLCWIVFKLDRIGTGLESSWDRCSASVLWLFKCQSVSLCYPPGPPLEDIVFQFPVFPFFSLFGGQCLVFMMDYQKEKYD